MYRTNTKLAQWMGFMLLIWLISAGGVCLAGSDLPVTLPIENPLGDMEDPTGGESESENDKETDEDSLYEVKSFVFVLKAFQKKSASEWDRMQDDPCHNLNYPPPKLE